MEKVIIKLSDLTPDPENVKLHTKDQIKHLVESIRMFGFNDPIAVWGDNNLIVEGNGRFLALKELGWVEVECIRLDFLSEEECKAYAIAHNQLCLDTGMDPDKLKAVLKTLVGKINMEAIGLKIPMMESTDDIVEDNYIAPEQIEPRIKVGEVYQLGRHRLVCGDSTKNETYQKLMSGEVADLVITDPPYNVNYKSESNMTIKNDNLTSGEFRHFLKSAFECMAGVMKPGAAFYVWYASNESINFEQALNEAGLIVRQQLIWVKNQFTLGRQDYQWRHEPRMYGWKDGASHYFCNDRTQSTVQEEELEDDKIEKMKKDELVALCKKMKAECQKMPTTVEYENKPLVNDIHPTMKPITITARMVINSSRKEEIVLDIFGGSGSTLIAAEQTGRACRIIELDERYASAIIDRWEKFTGQKAVKVNE